ncbi:hypothetical protein BJV78DRAFT_1176510 [Lactifluus subvellereus]|nr:hypothetical protein BJV78DRAFT_1176510 [Lactifluus subvellereus]
MRARTGIGHIKCHSGNPKLEILRVLDPHSHTVIADVVMELTDGIRQEIGQHFVVGFDGIDVNPDIEILIRDYHVGNVIIMKRNVQSAQQMHALVQKLQGIAKDAGHERPLMIGTDQENGLVSAFNIAHSNEAGTQLSVRTYIKLGEKLMGSPTWQPWGDGSCCCRVT